MNTTHVPLEFIDLDAASVFKKVADSCLQRRAVLYGKECRAKWKVEAYATL